MIVSYLIAKSIFVHLNLIILFYIYIYIYIYLFPLHSRVRSTFLHLLSNMLRLFVKWSIRAFCAMYRMCQMNSKGRKENRNYGYELLLRVAYANKLLLSSSFLADILFRVKRISYRESKQHFISWVALERFLVCVITRRWLLQRKWEVYS